MSRWNVRSSDNTATLRLGDERCGFASHIRPMPYGFHWCVNLGNKRITDGHTSTMPSAMEHAAEAIIEIIKSFTRDWVELTVERDGDRFSLPRSANDQSRFSGTAEKSAKT